MGFEVEMVDGSVLCIEGADSYEPEGPMTTFFDTLGRHQRLSAFSVRVASYRTDRLASIRRADLGRTLAASTHLASGRAASDEPSDRTRTSPHPTVATPTAA